MSAFQVLVLVVKTVHFPDPQLLLVRSLPVLLRGGVELHVLVCVATAGRPTTAAVMQRTLARCTQRAFKAAVRVDPSRTVGAGYPAAAAAGGGGRTGS